MTSDMNRIANSGNRFQGDFKRVLCVCSAGLLRSPTAAWVLGKEPYNYNTRAVGISSDFALIPLDSVHLHWADEIVCMGEDHAKDVKFRLKTCELNKPVICLGVPDRFGYRDPKLVEMILEKYKEVAKP